MSQSYATKKSKADRWETLDHRWNQICRNGAYPETRAEDVAEQTIHSINNEAKCTRKTKEKLLGARKTLESLTQKAAFAHERRKLAGVAIVVASPREPPDK